MKTAAILALAMAGLTFWARNRAAAQRSGGAHSPDGQDASASFRAGIADENSIPYAMPTA